MSNQSDPIHSKFSRKRNNKQVDLKKFLAKLSSIQMFWKKKLIPSWPAPQTHKSARIHSLFLFKENFTIHLHLVCRIRLQVTSASQPLSQQRDFFQTSRSRRCLRLKHSFSNLTKTSLKLWRRRNLKLKKFNKKWNS